MRSAVDFDAYEAIFIHSLHYSPSYFSLVGFIFFNCILIFFRPRRADDDQFHLMISVGSISSCSKRGKAVHNDEIEIMIADRDHTHAWAEIRATYNWSADIAVQRWIFVQYKIRKTSEWVRILPYKGSHQLCFSSRDQILATLIRKHCPACTAWRFLI